MTLDHNAIWELVDQCLSCLGDEGFIAPALDFVEILGADQVMVFTYEADRAGCLLSRNYTHEPTAVKLAADYLDEWYKRDPLYPVVMDLTTGEALVMNSDGLAKCLDTAGVSYGPEQLSEVVAEGLMDGDDQPLASVIGAHLNDHLAGQAPPDDVTLVALEVRA